MCVGERVGEHVRVCLCVHAFVLCACACMFDNAVIIFIYELSLPRTINSLYRIKVKFILMCKCKIRAKN